nr:hypothetical protein [Tanacetum cinerariifolium]
EIADTTSANGLVCLYSEKDVSNDLNLSSKQNVELNVGRFSRIMLGIVGGGIGVLGIGSKLSSSSCRVSSSSLSPSLS